MSRSSRQQPSATTTSTDSAAVIVRRLVTTVTMCIAGLTFAFSFGNIWTLGLQLGVTGWVAPLVAPAVDLSVMGLLTALAYLRATGTNSNLAPARLLLIFSGLVTLALNTTASCVVGEYGRGAFDAVAPVLLIGWSEVAPKLLAALHGTISGPLSSSSGRSAVVRDERPVVPDELVARAKQLDREHREATGRPISRDKLRSALHVSNAVAGEVLRLVRSDHQTNSVRL